MMRGRERAHLERNRSGREEGQTCQDSVEV